MQIDRIRSWFPALRAAEVFLDNAGGSQVPRTVIERMQRYLQETYVQLGADYATSKRASATVDAARAFVRTLVGGDGVGEVVLGASTSALCAMLADCHARTRTPGRDEIVVCEADHEANVAPWLGLRERGYTLRTWRADPASGQCDPAALRALLSERTRLVAVRHVSNLLGAIEDIAAVVDAAHAVGARVLVDGVAMAPHRLLDVAAWGVDWYVYSAYKVYGPHVAVLFGRHEAFAELDGPAFYFQPRTAPRAFELGGVCHESCAGLLGTADYFGALAGREACDRAAIERAFALIEAAELPLQQRLLAWLAERDDVRLIGPSHADAARVPTISFTHLRRSSREIAWHANAEGLGIRYGHFYSHRLALALGLDPADGVVRASLLHYNTLDEVERLIECLRAAF